MSKTKRARYQFYLDKKVVGDVADMGRELGLTRSQIVRDAMESLTENYAAKVSRNHQPDYQKLLDFLGIIKIPFSNLSSRVDDIYLIDMLKEQHVFS